MITVDHDKSTNLVIALLDNLQYILWYVSLVPVTQWFRNIVTLGRDVEILQEYEKLENVSKNMRS